MENNASDYTFKTLEGVPFSDLYETFSKAYENYYVPMSFPEDILAEIFTTDGVDFSHSVGAFDSNNLVGFICIALDTIDGEKISYNDSTGVVPSHRGKGLTKRMLEFIFPKLKSSGYNTMLLHVIEENEPAIKVYKKIGFENTRKSMCYRLNMSELRKDNKKIRKNQKKFEIKQIDLDSIKQFYSWHDWTPCWFNSFSCAKRVKDQVVLYGCFLKGKEECVGYIIFHQNILQILQICIKKEYRRRGIGSRFIRHLDETLKVPGLSYLGVDAVSGQDTIKFLSKLGFEVFMTQWEMKIVF